MKKITRYVKLVRVEEYPELLDIKLYRAADGTGRTKGKIKVPKSGAIIFFRPVTEQLGVWNFHSLTIHPIAAELTKPLDLRWTVYPSFVVLNHSKPAPGRHFRYTLCIETGPARVYLDPQMVDSGGGP